MTKLGLGIFGESLVKDVSLFPVAHSLRAVAES